MSLLFAAADLEQQISSTSLRVVAVASLVLVVLVILSIILRDRLPPLKPWLFGALSLTLILPTLFLAISTVYLNVKSDSGGPVHWHADFELWACGQQLELRDPTGFLSNKIGTATLHEHNDQRIHLEGVAVNVHEDASLGKFMRVIGGEVSSDSYTVPLNAEQTPPAVLTDYVTTNADGPYASFISGQSCAGQPAEVQVFAYRFDPTTNTYSQRKLDDPAAWVIAPESQVPPGDCLIIDFDTPKDRTDKLCEQFGVRDIERCEEFGVKPDKREVCDIREVPAGGDDV